MYRQPKLHNLASQPVTPQKEERFAALRAGMADGTINWQAGEQELVEMMFGAHSCGACLTDLDTSDPGVRRVRHDGLVLYWCAECIAQDEALGINLDFVP
jgi:hypothetical protein